MMNMMNRFVEGRGHLREIDMLLELTYVFSFDFTSPFSSCINTCADDNLTFF